MPLHLRCTCRHISLRSTFVIISIKADRDNKRKEIKRGGKIEMKEWMNKSADCVGAVMGRSIIGRNAKWQHGSKKNETEGRERVRWRRWGSMLGSRIKEKREGRARRGGGGEIEEMQEGFKWSERERERVRWAAVYVLTWNHLSFLSGAQLSWKSANMNDCLSCLYISIFCNNF